MSSTLNLKFCPNCGERLSYTSFEGYCAFADCLWNNEECTSPGQQDQGARLAASAQVDQVGGTPTLEQFQRWLEDRAHEASHAFDKPPAKGDSLKDHQWRCSTLISSCRAATSLLMLFKLEQGK